MNTNKHITAEKISQLSPASLKRFQTLFKRFCNDLDSSFERANEEYNQHMPSKGDVCEAAVARYLSESLGTRYAIETHGHIFDSDGKQSDEMDVVIFDDHWIGRITPKGSGEPPIIPVESVYSVIQVKKTLSSADLRSAIQNIRSFKSLKRENVWSDYITPNKIIQGFGIPGKKGIRNPYYGAVFAFSAGRSIETVLKQLKQEVVDIPVEERPDIIMIYKEGVILPECVTCKETTTHISQIALDGHVPSYFFDSFDGSYSLLGFHFLLTHHLHYTILAPPKYQDLYAELAYISRSMNLLDSQQLDNLLAEED